MRERKHREGPGHAPPDGGYVHRPRFGDARPQDMGPWRSLDQTMADRAHATAKPETEPAAGGAAQVETKGDDVAAVEAASKPDVAEQEAAGPEPLPSVRFEAETLAEAREKVPARLKAQQRYRVAWYLM